MKKVSFFLLATLLFSACRHDARWQYSGTAENHQGEWAVLQHTGLKETTTVDSVKIGKDGSFTVHAPLTTAPEFYRLRLPEQTLVLVGDSVYQAEQTAQVQALQQMVKDLSTDDYKAQARDIILSDPRSAAAYYALFQRKAGQFIFNPYTKEDLQLFQVVATAWNSFYPETERTKALYNLTLRVMQEDRKEQNRAILQDFIAQSENAFLDIDLMDENGKLRYLSDFRGKPILLDFSAYTLDGAAEYIFALRQLWNTYHSKGLQIYSVSADQSELLWQDKVQNLPWVTVRPEDGLRSEVFVRYNVQQIPTLFLFDKSGEIVGRFDNFDKLEQKIKEII